MLSERVCRLLTAYIDGELSERQRAAVERLIEESAEARDLAARLQSDANILRSAARQQLPTEFTGQVMEAILRRPLPSRRGRLWHVPPAVLAWSGAAASFFLVIAAGYFHFGPGQNAGPIDAVAQAPAPAVRRAEAPPREQAPQLAKDLREAPSPAPTEAPRDKVERKETGLATASAPTKAAAGAQPSEEDKAFGAAGRSAENLEIVRAGLPLTLPLRELNGQPAKERLRKGLEKESAYHVELLCRGNGNALPRLRIALEAQQVALLVDEVADARLARGRSGNDYLLYIQDLTATELAALLQRLASEDDQAESARKGSGEFESFTVAALSLGDRRELHVLLGGDPLATPALAARPQPGLEAKKSRSDPSRAGAARSITAPTASRLSSDAPAPTARRMAVLMPYVPGRPKSVTSIQVRQFLTNRKPRRPEAIQVFLVVHGANG